MIRIAMDDRALREALERLQQRLGDLSPAMQDIGELLAERAKERFPASTDPAGRPWATNSPATIAAYIGRFAGSRKKDGSLSKRGAARAAGKKPLIGETRQLMGTIYYRADRASVTVGSPMRYAAIHQFGGQAGRDAVLDILREYLADGNT